MSEENKVKMTLCTRHSETVFFAEVDWHFGSGLLSPAINACETCVNQQ